MNLRLSYHPKWTVGYVKHDLIGPLHIFWAADANPARR